MPVEYPNFIGYDTEAAVDEAPSYISTAPVAAAPIVAPPAGRYEGAPEPVIAAAVDQLNAGQPVTALPRQEWSFDQAQAFNAQLNEFDRRAREARFAAQQSAREATLFDQMTRSAKSAKDIQLALEQQDLARYMQNVANGMNPVEAFARSPRIATTARVNAAKALQPVAPPSFGTSPSGRGYAVDARGGIHFEPNPSNALLPPVARRGEPITDDEGNVIAYDTGRGHTVTKPTLDPTARANINALQDQLREVERNLRSKQALAMGNTPAMAPQMAQWRAQRQELMTRLNRLLPDAYPAPDAGVRGPDGATGTIHELPAAKGDLVVGDLYETRRGVGRWNGSQFELVPTR